MAKPPLKTLLATPAAQLILTSYKLAAVPEAVRDHRGLTHLGLQKNRLRVLPIASLPDALVMAPALRMLSIQKTRVSPAERKRVRALRSDLHVA